MMNGKKSTITNRARHRPKANLGNSMITKLLSFLHRKSVQVSASLGTLAGAWLFAKGWVSEEGSLMIAGAVATVLGVVVKEVVVWIASRFVKDKQALNGLFPDGYAGPVTREVTNTPKLNADGSPILPAIPPDRNP